MICQSREIANVFNVSERYQNQKVIACVKVRFLPGTVFRSWFSGMASAPRTVY